MPPKGNIVIAEKPLEGEWNISWVKEGGPIWVELPVKEINADAFLPATLTNWDPVKKTGVAVYEGPKAGPNPIRIDRFFERVTTYKELDDLIDIECLNDPELLENLRKKFVDLKIFTYCGPTLLIMNPYQNCDKFFVDAILKEFAKAANSESFQLKDKQPHVWAISALTYWQLFANLKQQAICISGESGAGKTVNTKFCMQFLTYMSSQGEIKEGEERIEDKILGCNPILEAFGNAKTVRNDNSSRFGKYVDLICKVGKGKADSKIIGARTINYLLEKSRIVSQTLTERNYHIFYQLMYSCTAETLAKYKVENNPEKYDILRKSKCFKVEKINDVGEFAEVTKSFTKMSFTEEEVDIVYSVVCSCLNLGNVQFDDSEFDGSKFCKIDKNDKYLPYVAEVLGLNLDALAKSLTRVLFTVQGKTSERAIDLITCNMTRDALAKDLFEKLFNWLVKRLNLTILPDEDRKAGGYVTNKKDRFTIGLLDIFGFEIFQINSLEQFCINFTNENLHQLYIEYVFKAEEKIFVDEGLKEFIASELHFEDNTAVIEMLAKGKESLISLLNESTRTAGPEPKKNDEKFYGNIKNFLSKNIKFKIPKLKPNNFTIVHTAREVDYDINNFITKNQDSLSQLILDVINNSTKRQLVRVFKNILSDDEQVVESDAPEDKNKKFLAYKFNQQMFDLMTTLRKCECNFVRCLKPNEEKKPGVWDPALTINQIRYLGILDSIKIRKTSYPNRKEFKQFYRRYIDLDPVGSRVPFKHHENNPDTNWKALCQAVHKAALPEFGNSQILFGSSKVFMRIEIFVRLEEIYKEKLKKKMAAVKVLEAYLQWYNFKSMFTTVVTRCIRLTKIIHDLVVGWKSKINYRQFRLMRNLVTKIQKRIRFKLYLRFLRKKRNAGKIIKASFESTNLKQSLQKKLDAAKLINRVWRGAIARKERRRLLMFKSMVYEIYDEIWNTLLEIIRQKAIITIQKHVRGWLTRRKNKALIDTLKAAREAYRQNRAATIIQKHVKGRIARKRYLRMLAAAKYIQGFFLTQWLSAMFQNLRSSSLKIQIAMRKFLARKHIMDKRLAYYMKFDGNTLYDLQELEYTCLIHFANGLKYSPSNQESQHPAFNISVFPEVSKFNTKKVYLWMYVLDIDYTADLSLVYDPIWSEQYKTLFKEVCDRGAELQMIEVGSSHTMAIGNNNKLYSWGLNDYGQLGRDIEFNVESHTVNIISLPLRGNSIPKIKMIAVGDEHNLLISQEGELYVNGRNDKGQLALENDEDIGEFIFHPTLNSVDMYTSVHAKGSQSLAIGESGSVYYWPLKIGCFDFLSEPIRLKFSEQTKIISASCGFDFSIFLSSKGCLYAMGKNYEGQLGLGDTTDRESPTLIDYLCKEKKKVTSVSCGFRHSICRCSNGKVYTWGWGNRGQLGHGNILSYSEPRAVAFSSKIVKWKVIQAQASYRSSIVLLEDLSIYWWGTNGSLQQQNSPIKLLRREFEEGDGFSPVKIMTSWSKGLGITYCTIGDSRKVDMIKSSKIAILGQLASLWEPCMKDVDAPISENLIKHFAGKNIGSNASEKNIKNDKKTDEKQKILLSKARNSNKLPTQTDIVEVKTKAMSSNVYEKSMIEKNAKNNEKSRISVTPKKPEPVMAVSQRPSEKMETSSNIKKISHVNNTKKAEPKKQYPDVSPKKVKEHILKNTTNPTPEEKLQEVKYRLELITRKPPSKWTIEEKNYYKFGTDLLMTELLSTLE